MLGAESRGAMQLRGRISVIPGGHDSPGLIVVAFIDEDLDRSMTAFRQGEGMNKPRFVRTKSGLREEVPADRPNALVRFLDAHSALWTAAVVISRRVARSYPTGEWWHLNAAVLDVIAADCGAQGVPVLFVRLPGKARRSFTSLQRLMDSRKFNYLDLDAAAPNGMHFENDAHINVAGHRFVADAIVEWMAKHPHQITQGKRKLVTQAAGESQHESDRASTRPAAATPR